MFLKQSGLANQLKQTVYHEVSIMWNSRLAMLKSACTQFENIEALSGINRVTTTI